MIPVAAGAGERHHSVSISNHPLRDIRGIGEDLGSGQRLRLRSLSCRWVMAELFEAPPSTG